MSDRALGYVVEFPGTNGDSEVRKSTHRTAYRESIGSVFGSHIVLSKLLNHGVNADRAVGFGLAMLSSQPKIIHFWSCREKASPSHVRLRPPILRRVSDHTSETSRDADCSVADGSNRRSQERTRYPFLCEEGGLPALRRLD